MSDEDNAGASYLAALKRSGPQAAGAAAARAPSSSETGAPASGHSFPGDKRRSPRYPCQGSAHLREIGNGVATWATFTDISLHGCYVEAMSTFRLGTKVSVTIEVNGFRVESQAEVRVVYPNLGMGLSFTTMSDPDRERLRELLRSLSRPSVIMGANSREIPSVAPQPGIFPPVANPGLALGAVTRFFEQRHLLSREEFIRILRHSQTSGT
jgi:PilZ domain